MLTKIKKIIKSTYKLIAVTILMSLPLCIHILALKLTKNRYKQYATVMGTNPKSILVFDDIVLIDLSDMEI